MKIGAIDIGHLDRQVDIKTYTTTVHPDTGQESRDVETSRTVYANVLEADPSKEVNDVNQRRYRSIIKVLVRYREWMRDVTGVVTYDGDDYEIEQVREVNKYGRRQFMTITAVRYE